MPDYNALYTTTQSFFNLHWPNQLGPYPEWSDPWYYKGEIPKQDSRGCYAWFNENDELLYIGIGLGKNGDEGPYSGNGLGARLNRVWRKVREGVYEPRENYQDVHHIRTLNFKTESEDFFWLGAALEVYLIKKLQPSRNITYK